VRFRDKYGLPFPLLADPDHRVAELYGAWGEKTHYGKTYVGVIRSTFVIDPDGIVLSADRNVKAAENSAQVLALLDDPPGS
jgi:peroxiredoxin Q/BCP